VIFALVISVLIVLAGTSYWYEETHKPVLKVNVGYANATYIIRNPYSGENVRMNNTTNVITTINNGEGIIDLHVHQIGFYVSGGVGFPLEFYLEIYTNVTLEHGLFADNFFYTAKELDNGSAEYDFLCAHSVGVNATVWSDNDIVPGAIGPNIAFIGFNPNSTNFKTYGAIEFFISNYSFSHTYTFRIEGICKIDGNNVPVIFDLVLKIIQET